MKSGMSRLFALAEMGKGKVDLWASQRLKAALGHPDYAYISVHVGGTNGKGSVATKIAGGLELAGNKVGLFTSPHLVSYEERFRINGTPLPTDEVEAGLNHLFSLCDAHKIAATYFELSSALALHLFAENGVDYAVIEVGMGGRFDATNVITPALSVITSIGLDHTDRLGNTLKDIAQEKGGIIKPEVPVILGPTAQGLGLEERARELGSPCEKVVGTYPDFRAENRATAQLALKNLGVSPRHIKQACQVETVGRFASYQLNGGLLLIDVAHNPPALIRLFQLIELIYPHLKRRAIAAFTLGHDTDAMLEICSQETDALSLATLNSYRSVLLPGAAPFEAVWEETLKVWDPESELLILCGSCYLVGEFFESRAGLEMCGGWQSGGGPRTTRVGGGQLTS